ncbi:EF-hand domain-containing protein [Bradyrhizobium sp. WSM 1738]|uniref:EF-hand domain-containing protein n=1 Tax=Bradyrhizobium hereditatis TaxID=2821405 RepID=UPI001CE25D98|nr:EF-hand domain-containing protein [Bradyrhizobium hereditatis]MCA6119022.1 EF-hand domain-containing protein [Bradyrhizobium hereditatis]
MFFALGVASSAIDALKALTSSKSSAQTTGVSQSSDSPFAFMSSNASASIGPGTGSGGTGTTPISPEIMSALLEAQSQSSGGSGSALKTRHAALKDLFGQIDGDGDGQISKAEFEEALGAGGTNLGQADSVFGKLDQDGDGSVSIKELASALRLDKERHRRPDEAKASDGAGTDPLSQLRQGATTTTVTNSDGSVTTSLTYADGSKVTMTSPASASSSTSATSSYNFIEQMIQREAKAISSAATASLSLSA